MPGCWCRAPPTRSCQSAIIVVLSLAIGARFHGGAAGIAAMIVVAVLLGSCIASISNGFSLLVRQRESLIGMVTMISLPLAFLSTLFMEKALLPSLDARREPLQPGRLGGGHGPQRDRGEHRWSQVAAHVALLAALAAVCTALATLAFRTYTRSM